jgi:DNA-binding NarL/FixJ family response regulator
LPKIRLLLVDDNPAMLATLAVMLERDFIVAGVFPSGAAVLAKFAELNPDVIVLDVSLGDMTGFYVAKRLRSAGCAARILFLSVHENLDFVGAAFDLGGSGYVYKSQIDSDLVGAIKAVARGERFTPAHSAFSAE